MVNVQVKVLQEGWGKEGGCFVLLFADFKEPKRSNF